MDILELERQLLYTGVCGIWGWGGGSRFQALFLDRTIGRLEIVYYCMSGDLQYDFVFEVGIVMEIEIERESLDYKGLGVYGRRSSCMD